MTVSQNQIYPVQSSDSLYRILAGYIVAFALMFIVNDVATFWFGWPGFIGMLGYFGLFGLDAPEAALEGMVLIQGILQLFSYLAVLLLVIAYVKRRPELGLQGDAQRYSDFASYIIRAAYWSVLLVGLVDMAISFLRVENMLEAVVGADITSDLGRPQYRGTHVHYPLILLGCVIAYFVRTLGFVWLAVWVVFAEFQIVLSRFVFSYEQAFMGDLVRFWYAALFLFASSYALINDGHVRVDVLYAGFSKRGKAWANACGSILLGLPICYTILVLGMWGRGSSLNSPLLSFEISQSGYGMYVKYLMAGFLVVFAISMIVQFAGFFLDSVAVIKGQDIDEESTSPTTSTN